MDRLNNAATVIPGAAFAGALILWSERPNLESGDVLLFGGIVWVVAGLGLVLALQERPPREAAEGVAVTANRYADCG